MPEGFLPSHTRDHNDTIGPVTKEEIDTLLRNSKKDSATGHDGITYEMLIHIETAFATILPRMYQALLHHGMFQQAWKHAVCVPIPKTVRTDTSNL